jgi:hypothetical protein
VLRRRLLSTTTPAHPSYVAPPVSNPTPRRPTPSSTAYPPVSAPRSGRQARRTGHGGTGQERDADPDPDPPRRIRQRPQKAKPAAILQPRSHTAAQLNISIQGVIRLERAGKLRCVKLGGSEASRAYNVCSEVEALATGRGARP